MSVGAQLLTVAALILPAAFVIATIDVLRAAYEVETFRTRAILALIAAVILAIAAWLTITIIRTIT